MVARVAHTKSIDWALGVTRFAVPNHKSVIRKAEVMYELSDWGSPLAPPEFTNREKVTAQLPYSLVRVLRSRARAQGVSLNVLVDRLLHEAVALPNRREGEPAATVAAAFD